MENAINIVTLSVRNLVEFIFRSGDITSGGSAPNTDAMQAGSRIHRKIQKSMGLGYEAEVSLSTDILLKSNYTGEDFVLRIDGRADGIFRNEDAVTIDEIKGVLFDIDELTEPVFIHKAQAMCYAYIVCQKENLKEITVQITYCHIETERIRRFSEVFSKKEITDWFNELINKYKKWAIYQYDWSIKRNKSIEGLEFPFEYRAGQKNLAAFVYRNIEKNEKLFIQAPTGVGKTITTVFPSIKSMGQGLTERIFYLTAKTITRTVAEDCFSLLCDKNLLFKHITITAKEKVCVLEKLDCNPNECPRANGHFDRINDALYDMLTNEDKINRDIITDYAQKHNVCPFEMSLDAALYCDAIICDYNYVFDPNVYLRRFFAGEKKNNIVLLVDEAHNLVERAREMFSATLVKEDFLEVKRIISHQQVEEKRPEVLYNLRKFEKSLDSANKALLKLKRNCSSFNVIDLPVGLDLALLRVLSNFELFNKDYKVLPAKDTVLNFFFSVKFFSTLLEVIDEKYRIYTSYDSEGKFYIKLQCMDPSTMLKNVFSCVKSSILFSATLLPIKYYKEQLCSPDDNAVYAKSSFSPDKRKILIANDVSSKYTRRGPKEYQKIADYIKTFVNAKLGNYLIFFPSYTFMENVISYLDFDSNVKLLVQGTNMSEDEREQFINSFESGTSHSVVGCCVMGGIFSEGIDLKKDRLIGACIVGTGLPMVCNERELFKDYYNETTNSGFEYAYLYPGVNKVFQAGGRVIRTAEDTGVILLLDERFNTRQYLDLFPREWFPYDVVNLSKMELILKEFYKDS